MFKLASSIGFALALAELKQRVRRLVTQGILGAIGAVLFLIGFCFLLVAAHLYLSQLLNPIASAAIIGGALLVIALMFFLIASMKGSGAARRAQPASVAEDNMARLADAVGPKPLANPALVIAGLALVLGFLFGRRTKSDG
jgi:Putative Actinobacterial Holin-X, holin superfamily III